MAITEEQIRSISGAFHKARYQALPLPDFPGPIPGSLEDAYRVQDFAIQAWDDRVAGWKIGGIPVSRQAEFNGVGRLVGPIFSRSIQHAQPLKVVPYPIFAGGFAAVEAEIVLRISRDFGSNERRPADVRELVDAAWLGIETAGSPLAKINDLGPPAVISDFCNNHGLVVGPEIPGWSDSGFGDLWVRTLVEGICVGEGSPGDIPWESLAFLLDTLARRGRGLARGDLVSTGAITGIHPVSAGASSRVEIEGLAAIEVQSVADPGR